MAESRESARIKDAQQRRVLDEAARRRRQRKALEALEQDNFQEDPHADLKMSKKAPKFEESMESSSTGGRKKRKFRSEHFKYRFKKSFAALIEEEHLSNKESPSYFGACAPPSKLPPRHFCAVCGFPSNYTCVQCGARYCSVKCLGTHQDTSIELGAVVFNLWVLTKILGIICVYISVHYTCVCCRARYCSVKVSNYKMLEMDSLIGIRCP